MYIELEFPLADPTESEILCALLADFGFEGIAEMQSSIKAYIPKNQFNEKELMDYLERFPKFGKLMFNLKTVPDKNWNEAWERSYDAVEVAGKVRIRASFHQPDKSFDYDLLIDPQMSFGTGHHETTQLMIEMMLGMDFRDKSVLDFGSGTGVLSLFAHKMGAKSVIAIDIDEWAFNNIQENIIKNNAENIHPVCGDTGMIPDKKFEIILANVNKNIISANMELLACRLFKNGIILFSGLLAGDESDILKTALDNDLILQEKKTKSEWLCLKFAGR